MATPILPKVQSQIIDGAGYTRSEWYDFFRNLLQYVDENSDTAAEIAAILLRLDALEGDSETFTIVGLQSIQVNGTPESGAVSIQLQGDAQFPAATQYYGTDATGDRGFYNHAIATLSDVDLTPAPVLGNALLYDGTSKWKPGAVLANPMTTQGDVIYGGVAGVATRLAAGTATYVLTSNGPGLAPSWQAGGGGGGSGVWGSITGSIAAQTDLMQHFATAALLDTPFL